MAGRGLQDIPLRVPEQWDAAWFTRFVREVLALADVRNAIEGTGISISGSSSEVPTLSADSSIAGLLNVPFVTLALSSQLTAERVLTAGSGIAFADGGAGSTLTVSLDGIPYDLFADMPPLSVFGNQLPDASPPSAIGGEVAGDVLWIRDVDGGGTLNIEFGNEPVWTGDHQWVDDVGIELGTGQDLTLFHDGTDSEIVNVTGNLTIENSGGDVLVTALEDFIVSTDGTEHLRIDADGAWLLASDPGTAAQVLTSNGSGTPPTWEDSASGSTATYLTATDETATLTNSRRLIAGTNITLNTTTPGQMTISASGGGGGSGSLSFVDEAVVAGSATNTLTVSGLDLDTDECYYIEFDLNNATGSNSLMNLYVNADTTAANYTRQRTLQVNTSVTAARENNADLSTALAGQSFCGRMWMRRGQDGLVYATYEGRRGGPSDLGGFDGIWMWDVASTNVTSISFITEQANALSIGAAVRVWKLVAA